MRPPGEPQKQYGGLYTEDLPDASESAAVGICPHVCPHVMESSDQEGLRSRPRSEGETDVPQNQVETKCGSEPETVYLLSGSGATRMHVPMHVPM